MTEEELQNSIEKGLQGDGLDVRAYRMVFNTLQKEPNYKLPSNFADRVVARIEAASRQSASRELVWLYVGLFSFVIAAGVAVAMTGFKVNFGALKFISGYPGLFVFGAVFILALQWFDKKFVKKSTTY